MTDEKKIEVLKLAVKNLLRWGNHLGWTVSYHLGLMSLENYEEHVSIYLDREERTDAEVVEMMETLFSVLGPMDEDAVMAILQVNHEQFLRVMKLFFDTDYD